MRKLIASTMVSLDGVMQAPGGPEEDPSGSFAFGGWSWGASIGVHLGAANPTRVTALVLIDAGHTEAHPRPRWRSVPEAGKPWRGKIGESPRAPWRLGTAERL